jgi:hypothetical protein
MNTTYSTSHVVALALISDISNLVSVDLKPCVLAVSAATGCAHAARDRNPSALVNPCLPELPP